VIRLIKSGAPLERADGAGLTALHLVAGGRDLIYELLLASPGSGLLILCGLLKLRQFRLRQGEMSVECRVVGWLRSFLYQALIAARAKVDARAAHGVAPLAMQ
jgi:hypothetical protein